MAFGIVIDLHPRARRGFDDRLARHFRPVELVRQRVEGRRDHAGEMSGACLSCLPKVTFCPREPAASSCRPSPASKALTPSRPVPLAPSGALEPLGTFGDFGAPSVAIASRLRR